MRNVFGTIKNPSEADKLKVLRYAEKGTNVLYSTIRYALLISIGFIILYPLLYMVVTSIMSPLAFANSTRVWIPTSLNIKDNYAKTIEALSYWPSLLNTLKIEVVSALLEVVSCAIAGYGFARFDFKGKKILTGILFATILVPDMMVLIPRMVNYSNLDFLFIGKGIEVLVHGIGNIFGADWTIDITPNIVNNPLTMWLPSLFGVGLRSGVLIYIYIQFFSGLPRELEEAAWVDGAGPFKTFLKIAVPSSSVVFITVLVFSLIWHWNDSLLSGMYLTSDFPLASALSAVEPYIGAKWGLYGGASTPQQASIVMASCLLFIAPMLIFYMFIQRGFIESIDRVGITG
ncbi:MAG: carbohydrate ABC transporter permease [Clostridia bacterium]|nr:carbohydrate ABC transporter permease [Clostridia bacterium]